MQYGENKFVLRESIQITQEFLKGVQGQLDQLMDGEDYVAFGEINEIFYKTLPNLPGNISWSPLLLVDILQTESVGYSSVEAGHENDRKTIPAAIVSRNSALKTFPDILWCEMEKEFSLPKELKSVEFREFMLKKGLIRGMEKTTNVHKLTEGDIRFFWTENNGKVTIN